MIIHRPLKFLLLFVGQIALILAVYLVYRATGLGNEQTLQRAITQAVQLQQDDTAFREAVLRTRYGIDPNYDALVAARLALHQDLANLSQLALPLAIIQDRRRLKSDMVQEDGDTENYKSLNSTVRNSMHYFLYQMRLLLPALPDQGKYADLQHELENDQVSVLETYLRGSQGEQLGNSDIGAPSVNVQHLLMVYKALPTRTTTVDLLIKHTRILAAQLPQLLSVTTQLTSSTVPSDLLGLQSDLQLALRQQLQKDLTYRVVLSALFFPLLVSVMLFFRQNRQMRLERIKAENRLKILSLIVEQSPSGVLLTDAHGVIEYANAAFEESSGYHRDEVIGQTPRLLQSGKTPKTTYALLWQAVQQGNVWRGEFVNRHKEGREYHESAIVVPIRQPDGSASHYVAFTEDITANRLAVEKIYQLSWYDALTRLPNRALFTQMLEQSLLECHKNKNACALILINLDRFKVVNDAYGYDKGDQLLLAVAERLARDIDDRLTLARLSGDEFCVIVQSQKSALSMTDFFALANQFALDLHAPFAITPDVTVNLTAALGVTTYPDVEHDTAQAVFIRADAALQQAKTNGGDQVVFFEGRLNDKFQQRFLLESDLRQAVAHGELRLYLQSQVNSSGELMGAEALVRWQHPRLGLLLPGTFIDIAEESNLIVGIGVWVLQEACQLMAGDASAGAWHLSVNVSARQFRQPDFIEVVQHILTTTGVDPNRLIFEVTESLIIDEFDAIVVKMQQLNAMGIRFSLDDFGTGYSSLAYLKRMPIYEMKIDKSFVQDIPHDADDVVLTDVMLAIAQHMHLQVVAEGVELQEQTDFLCQRMPEVLLQGYLYSRPEPVQDWLQHWVK